MKNLSLIFFTCAFRLVSSGTSITAETSQHQPRVYMNDFGVPITGKSSISLELNGCTTVSLFLSAKVSRHKSNAFAVILFRKIFGTQILLKETCIQCVGKQKISHIFVKHRLHECRRFWRLWVSWDERIARTLIIGAGSLVGRMQLVKLTTTKPFPINHLNVYGVKGKTQWRFLIDSPPTFVFPLPFGGSTVVIPEDMETKKVICNMKVTDPDKDVVMFSVTGQHSDIFGIYGTSMVLHKKVDFETKSVYTVQVTYENETTAFLGFDNFYRVSFDSNVILRVEKALETSSVVL